MTVDKTVDVLIIGGGIVGLSTALGVLKKRPDCKVLILEKEGSVGAHQTSHNSGVIHSGIYYNPGSQKALNCRRGYKKLLDFCQEHSINYRLCGKLIAAENEQELIELEKLYEKGAANGLEGLERVSGGEAKEKYEPHLKCLQALYVPEAGIINYLQVAEKIQGLINELGGEVRKGENVQDLSKDATVNSAMWRVATQNSEYLAKHVINCAGLYSDIIAEKSGEDLDTRIIPFRGEYYQLKKEKEYLVKSLIYPVPNPEFPFLGVHFTSMIGGGVEAGPNAVLALAREGYKKSDFNFSDLMKTLTWPGFYQICRKYWYDGLQEQLRSFSKKRFVESMQRLIPEIQEADVYSEGAGVRAQVCSRKGVLGSDFIIRKSDNIVHAINTPSPAATSCLAIGESIADQVDFT